LNLQGKLYVRGDSKIFRFQNGKTESLFLQRKNPRRIAWTMLYRRQHKKGISEVSLSNTFATNFPFPSDDGGMHKRDPVGIRKRRGATR
jgi:ribosomal protein L24E